MGQPCANSTWHPVTEREKCEKFTSKVEPQKEPHRTLTASRRIGGNASMTLFTMIIMILTTFVSEAEARKMI